MFFYNQKHILNIIFILLVVLLFFFCLFSKNMYALFFPKNQTHNLIESMGNADNSLSMDKYDDFCKVHNGKNHMLEESCSKLTYENCNKVSCCVHINGNKCVSGSNAGTTYKTDKNGDKINVDYYYYKNKCTGNCPK